MVVGGLGAAVTTVITVLALPGVAHAAALFTEVVRTGSDATITFDFNTTSTYWSVVGVYSDSDYDLDLSGSGSPLGSSAYGSARTDFIAIDSNSARRPLGAYQATVRRYSGTNPFAAEQMQGRFVTTLPTPANDGVSGPGDPDIAIVGIDTGRVVRITDIYLTAGQSFWVKKTDVDSDFFLLESDPSTPSTWVRSRGDAVSSADARVVDGCTIYTARFTGWHATVMVNNSWPAPTTPKTGTGYPMMRYSPSRPTSCPIKNFPGPTP
jgi:hypothetical protein